MYNGGTNTMGIIEYLNLKKFYLIILTLGLFIGMAGITPAVFASNTQNMDNEINNESNNHYIQSLAQSITKNVNTTNRSEIAKVIFNWMQDHIVYEKPMYYNSKHFQRVLLN